MFFKGNKDKKDKDKEQAATSAAPSAGGGCPSTCPSAGTCPSSQTCSGPKTDGKSSCPNPNRIKNVIGVMSGKGGVGKSTVTFLLASALREKGYRVGILDADITGASIPRIMKLPKYEARSIGDYILPMEADSGIRVMSINFLLENENQPVIWRGPLLSSALKQFWGEVYWGDLDFLLIDMPPGTSDVALTVAQSMKVDGYVFVTTPQDLVSMVVAKSILMSKKLGIRILGLIENMSCYVCPHCGEKTNFFGADDSDNLAREQGTEVLVRIPISKQTAMLPSTGLDRKDPVVAGLLKDLADRTLHAIETVPMPEKPAED